MQIQIIQKIKWQLKIQLYNRFLHSKQVKPTKKFREVKNQNFTTILSVKFTFIIDIIISDKLVNLLVLNYDFLVQLSLFGSNWNWKKRKIN